MTVAQELKAREAMLAKRGASIGSSDVAAIVGLDRWRTAADVYDSLVAKLDGHVGEGDATTTPDQLRGIILEDVAAELYCERNGMRMRRIGKVQHPALPFFHSNADRQVLADTDWDTHIAEIKVPRPQAFRRIVEHGADPYVAVQCMAHLSCHQQYDSVRNIYLDPVTMETYGIVLQRRKKLLAGIEKGLVEFWYECVEKRQRPVDFHVELPDLPELSGELEVWDDPEIVTFGEGMAKLHLIEQVGKKAAQVRKAAGKHFGQRMGQLKKVEVPGVGKFSHVVVPHGSTYDTKALDAHFSAQGVDPEEVGLKKRKSGYEYVRTTFSGECLDRVRPAAYSVIANDFEEHDAKQIEEGADE